MIGSIIALLSAMASGISVISVRKHSEASGIFNISLVITVVGLMLLLPLAFVERRFDSVTLAGFFLFALSGLLSPGLVRLFYYKGLKAIGASVNSSIFAVYPLYSSLLAVLFLGELATGWNMLGIVIIVLGVILVEMSINGKKETGQVSWKKIVAPIMGGLMLAVATIFRKFALQESNAPILGVAIAYVFSLLPYILTLAVYSPTRKELKLKKDFRLFWIAGIGQAVSWLLAFYALSLEQVSTTAALLSIEPLFIVAFGYFYLRKQEQVSFKLAASIAFTILGVAFITL